MQSKWTKVAFNMTDNFWNEPFECLCGFLPSAMKALCTYHVALPTPVFGETAPQMAKMTVES